MKIFYFFIALFLFVFLYLSFQNDQDKNKGTEKLKVELAKTNGEQSKTSTSEHILGEEPYKDFPKDRNFRTKEEIAERLKYFEEEERRNSGHYGESKEDSIARVKEEFAWRKTKAGKIFLKNPGWTPDECEKLAKGKVWIGMKYKMLIYMRGLPNSANPSNYGKGDQWQWCWNDYSPSCFYDHNDDGIVDSYN